MTTETTASIDMSSPEPLSTINRSAMARVVGIDLAHASRILSGQRNPSMKLAVKMADYLNLTLDQLQALLKATK